MSGSCHRYYQSYYLLCNLCWRIYVLGDKLFSEEPWEGDEEAGKGAWEGNEEAGEGACEGNEGAGHQRQGCWAGG